MFSPYFSAHFLREPASKYSDTYTTTTINEHLTDAV